MKYTKPIYSRESMRKPTPPGDRLKTEYMLDEAPDGTKRLVENGVVDIQEQIQSHKSECSIKDIIAKHEMLGTLEQLAVGEGKYFDTTYAPKNLMEFESVLRSARSTFENLKPEVRKDFTTFESFLENFGSIQTMNAFLERYKKSDVEKEDANDGKIDS